MNSNRYILEPYKGLSTRFNCPGCNARGKSFSRYIDTKTGQHIAPTVGRCNRESNCGYHYTPKQYFQDNDIKPETKINEPIKLQQSQRKPPSLIPDKLFKASLQGYENNHFIKFLFDLFGKKITDQLIIKYFIGTSKHWPGSTIFWQKDINRNIRTGKIMLYDPLTGKRVKQPFNHFTWVHSVIKQPEYNLKQCLFGEHLLNNILDPVAIVESEKTAIISSVYFPQFIWLASGGLSNLNRDKCEVLKERAVTLFPDLNGFEKWTNKARELSEVTNVRVSDLLEIKASEMDRIQGLDLADYLIKFNYQEFLLPDPQPREEAPEPEFKAKENFTECQPKKYPGSWTNEISDLEQFFNSAKLPPNPVKLCQGSTIIDINKFIKCEMTIIKAQNGNSRFLPYLERLKDLKRSIIKNLN